MVVIPVPGYAVADHGKNVTCEQTKLNIFYSSQLHGTFITVSKTCRKYCDHRPECKFYFLEVRSPAKCITFRTCNTQQATEFPGTTYKKVEGENGNLVILIPS